MRRVIITRHIKTRVMAHFTTYIINYKYLYTKYEYVHKVSSWNLLSKLNETIARTSL